MRCSVLLRGDHSATVARCVRDGLSEHVRVEDDVTRSDDEGLRVSRADERPRLADGCT